MISRRNLYRTLSVAGLVCAAAAGFAAVPSGTGQVEEGARNGTLNLRLDSTPDQSASTPDHVPSGNPLWAIPLKNLSATRERPIFSASRRPPPPAVKVAPYVPPSPPAKPAEPDTPRLSLLGTISSGEEGIGIFL